MSGRRRRRRPATAAVGGGQRRRCRTPAAPEPGPPARPAGRWPGWTTVCAEPPGWSKLPGAGVARAAARARASRWRPACRRRPWPRRPPLHPRAPPWPRSAAGRCGVAGARLACPAGSPGRVRGRVRRRCAASRPPAPAPNVPAHGRSTSGSGFEVRRGDRSSNCATSVTSPLLSDGPPPHRAAPSPRPGSPPSRCTSCSSCPNASARGAGGRPGSLAMACSSTAHSSSGTPWPRRSGMGWPVIRRNWAMISSPSRRSKAARPAMIENRAAARP